MRNVALSIAIISLTGCSHIPDPASVHPKIEPAHILKSIRCEIGTSLLEDYPKNHWIHKSDIAYGLTLTAEENNTLSAPLSFGWPIHLGTFTLGPSAGKERFRSGESIVNMAERISETIEDVIDRPRAQVPCLHDSSVASLAYPIVGSLGLRDVVRRFVEVNGIGPTNTIKEGGFTQTLKFHLKFLGGVKPSFALKHAGGFEASGNLEMHADRKDLHELIVKIAPPVKVVVSGKKQTDQEGARPPGTIRLVPPNSQGRLLDEIRTEQHTRQLRGVLRDVLR